MIGIKKQTGEFTSFDGTSIYYEIIGEGQPLILSYGIACTTNHWSPQIKYFSKNYQVILYDYRGHHLSAIPEDLKNMSVEAIGKDLKLLCEHLNITQASFWGHSFGAQVVCELYRIAPQLVHSIVMINGFHKNPIKGLFGMDMVPAFEKLKHMYLELPATFEFAWKSLLESPLALPAVALSGGFNLRLTDRKDIEVYLRGVKSIPIQVFLTLFESMMEFDGSDILPTVDSPCLLIAGDKDNVTPLSFQKSLHAAIRNSELQVIPYGSHCSQLDMPDFVNLKIEAFLEKHQKQED
tara:strand:+ start:6531 stop:7412 length:882 start_codon:yes stop_codon:yes gene_type:complete